MIWRLPLFIFCFCSLLLGSQFSVLQNEKNMDTARNVLGASLEACCYQPMTGFYRDGFCHTGPTDSGRHVVCAEMTQEFLDYTKAQGNDLCTPFPEYNFPGLKAGDRWCLCAVRWKEAYEVGKAPKVILESTNEAALRFIGIQDLKSMKLVK